MARTNLPARSSNVVVGVLGRPHLGRLLEAECTPGDGGEAWRTGRRVHALLPRM